MGSKTHEMRKLFFLPRFLALWLTLSLGLPDPAFALRGIQKQEAVPGEIAAGLEEGAGVLASGRELTSSEHRLVNEAIRQLIAEGQTRVLDADGADYHALDPEGALRGVKAEIRFYPGLNDRIRKLAQEAGGSFKDRLIAHPGSNQTQGAQKYVHLDAAEAGHLMQLEEGRRREWARHEETHLREPSLPEEAVQQRAPITEILAGLKRLRLEAQLPVPVREHLALTGQMAVVPESEKKLMVKLVKQGKRTEGEVVQALQLAREFQVTPGEILKLGERHGGLPIPMVGDLLEIAQAHDRAPEKVAQWVEKVFGAERQSGESKAEALQGWQNAPLEIKEETLETTQILLELWDQMKDEHEGGDQIPFNSTKPDRPGVVQLYDAIRSVDEVAEALEQILEIPLGRGDSRSYPYWKRVIQLMGWIAGENGYRTDMLDRFIPDPREEYRESGEGDLAGMEELPATVVTGFGTHLTPEQYAVVGEALQRIRRYLSPFLTVDGKEHYTDFSGGFTLEQLRDLDPAGEFHRAGITVRRVEFLDETARRVAQEKGVPFPPDFVAAVPVLEGKILYIDDSILSAIQKTSKKEQGAFIHYLTLRFTEPNLTEKEAREKAPEVAAFYQAFHNLPYRAFSHGTSAGLGMNLRRKKAAGKTRKPALLLRESSKEFNAFIQTHGLPSGKILERQQGLLLDQLRGYFGYSAKLYFQLGVNLEVPIQLAGADLTVDTSLLALPPLELAEWLRYSLEHMNRSNRVALEDPLARELAAYYQDAAELLKSPERLSLRVQALSHLDQQGWEVGAHLRYLEAISPLQTDPGIQKGLEPVTGYYVVDLINTQKFHAALKSKLTTDKRFLAEEILQAAQGSRPDRKTATALHKTGYGVPTFQEGLQFIQIRPDLSLEQALNLLRGNRWFLEGIRVYGWKEAAPLLSIWTPKQLADDLANGQKSFIAIVVDGMGASGLRQDKTLMYINFLDAVEPFDLFRTLFGKERLEEALGEMSFFEKVALFADIGRGIKAEKKVSPRRDETSFLEAFSPSARNLLAGIQSGRWSNAADYLRQNGDPQTVLEFLELLQVKPIAASATVGEKSMFERQSPPKIALLNLFIQQWGVALGPMFRTGQDSKLPSLTQSFLRDFQIGIAQSEEAALSPQGESALEAILLLQQLMRAGPPSDELLAAARDRLETVWPLILVVDLYDAGNQMAAERAAFRYLLTIRDPPSLSFLSQGLVDYLAAKPRAAPQAYSYAQALFRMHQDLPTNAVVARYLLLQAIPSAPDPESRSQRVDEFKTALLSRPETERRSILGSMIQTPEDLKELLQRASQPELKTFLLKNMSADQVADHFRKFDVTLIGELISGVDPAVVRQITSPMKQGRRGTDILHREVYEGFVSTLPEQVDTYRHGRLQNHYAVMGVPRSAPLEAIRRSYRLLAFAYHPDRFLHEGSAIQKATERMKKAAEAYAILSDSQKRADYNRSIPNKAHLYPSSIWYEQVPPEEQITEEQLSKESTAAGLEEKKVQETIRKLLTGTRRQRLNALPQIHGWLNPIQPALANRMEFLVEALVSNLEFFTPDVRGKAQQMLVELARIESYRGILSKEVPRMASFLRSPYPEIQQGAQETLEVFAIEGVARAADLVLAVTLENLTHGDPQTRQFAQDNFRKFILKTKIGSGSVRQGLKLTLDNLRHPNIEVRASAQETALTALKQSIAPELLPEAVAPTVVNLNSDSTPLKLSGLRFLAALAEARVAPDLLAAAAVRVMRLLEPAETNPIRIEASHVLRLFARSGVALDQLAGATTPLISSVSYENNATVRQAAQETLTVFAQAKVIPGILSTTIAASIANLSYTDSEVRRAAQRTLIAMADVQELRPAVLAALPAFFNLLQSRDIGVQNTAKETLVALSGYEPFFQVIQAKFSPADLGLDTDLNWGQLGPFMLAWRRTLFDPSFNELTFGARAVVRREVIREARNIPGPEALILKAKSWTDHFLRLEKLDENGLQLASAGSELHLPFEDPKQEAALRQAAVEISSGVGDHSMTLVHPEQPGQLDVRLLPAFPSTFSKLMGLFLEDPAMDRFFTVGAHYSLGVDLKEALSTLSLVLFYGDLHYPWLPYPGGKTDRGLYHLGFPGSYTYGGATLNPRTGRMTDTRQSNLHLRPIRVLQQISIGAGQTIRQPFELYPQDLERFVWLAAAAQAPQGSALAQIYQEFLQDWHRWIGEFQNPALLTALERAEKGVAERYGQGVNDSLDRASALIYQAIYEVSAETIAQAPGQVPPTENQARAVPRRQALARLIEETIQKTQSALMPDAEVREALLSYRQARDLEQLDNTYTRVLEAFGRAFENPRQLSPERATQLLKLLGTLDSNRAQELQSQSAQTLIQEFFKETRPAEEDARLLRLLEVFAPDQVGRIRKALATTAGLEETVEVRILSERPTNPVAHSQVSVDSPLRVGVQIFVVDLIQMHASPAASPKVARMIEEAKQDHFITEAAVSLRGLEGIRPQTIVVVDGEAFPARLPENVAKVDLSTLPHPSLAVIIQEALAQWTGQPIGKILYIEQLEDGRLAVYM